MVLDSNCFFFEPGQLVVLGFGLGRAHHLEPLVPSAHFLQFMLVTLVGIFVFEQFVSSLVEQNVEEGLVVALGLPLDVDGVAVDGLLAELIAVDGVHAFPSAVVGGAGLAHHLEDVVDDFLGLELAQGSRKREVPDIFNEFGLFLQFQVLLFGGTVPVFRPGNFLLPPREQLNYLHTFMPTCLRM